jgi:hypothetical protein
MTDARDWNAELQTLLDEMQSAASFATIYDVETKLHALHAQFVLTATA